MIFLFPLLLLWSVSMHASCADFVRFAEVRQGHKENASILATLYDHFLGHLSPSDYPFLIAIGGSPGAGKTTFRKQFLKMENVHVHDMDEVMICLPGYQKDVSTIGAKKAFENWWVVAQKIAQILVLYAMESRY